MKQVKLETGIYKGSSQGLVVITFPVGGALIGVMGVAGHTRSIFVFKNGAEGEVTPGRYRSGNCVLEVVPAYSDQGLNTLRVDGLYDFFFYPEGGFDEIGVSFTTPIFVYPKEEEQELGIYFDRD